MTVAGFCEIEGILMAEDRVGSVRAGPSNWPHQEVCVYALTITFNDIERWPCTHRQAVAVFHPNTNVRNNGPVKAGFHHHICQRQAKGPRRSQTDRLERDDEAYL
jgi:hypothetical protein